MPFSVVEVQPTPNPNALKFVLDRQISESTDQLFQRGRREGHPIASRLFAIPGVSSLLFLGDFVTVNKTADASWPPIKDQVRTGAGCGVACGLNASSSCRRGLHTSPQLNMRPDNHGQKRHRSPLRTVSSLLTP